MKQGTYIYIYIKLVVLFKRAGVANKSVCSLAGYVIF